MGNVNQDVANGLDDARGWRAWCLLVVIDLIAGVETKG